MVSHQVCHTLHIVGTAHHHDLVSHMEVVIPTGKKVHAIAVDSGHIHSVYAGEMHLSQCLSVHLRVGHHNASGYHRLLVNIFIRTPFYFNLWTDEGLDWQNIAFCTDNAELIPHTENGVTGWRVQFSVVMNTGAYNVSVQEV